MDINKIIEEGEKEFDEKIPKMIVDLVWSITDGGCQIRENQCLTYQDEPVREYEDIKAWHTSQQHKLLQSIVEMIDGMYYTNMTIEKPPTCDNESCTAKNSYNQGLSELKAKLTINIKE